MVAIIILLVIVVALMVFLVIKQQKSGGVGSAEQPEELLSEENRTFFNLLFQSKLDESLRDVHGKLDEESKEAAILKAYVKDTMSAQIDNSQKALAAALTNSSEALEKSLVNSSKDIREDLGLSAENEKKLLENLGVIYRTLTATKIRGKGAEKQIAEMLKRGGLRPGLDFEEQASIFIDGQTRKPDFVINLPKQKRLIVDSKLPLDKYIEMVEAEHRLVDFVGDPKEIRATITNARKSFIAAIGRAIDELAKKGYHRADNNAIGQVIMLIPNEAVCSFISNEAPELLERGEEKNILIMSPSQFIIVIGISKEMVDIVEAQNAIGSILKEHKKFGLMWITFQKLLSKVDAQLSTFSKEFREALTYSHELNDQVAAIDNYKELPKDETENKAISPLQETE